MRIALLVALLQGVTVEADRGPPGDTTRLVPDSAAMATAYQDATARELVRLARGQRGVIDASVFRYTATSHQRLSVGIRALRRDRLVYRRETASVIHWRRDGPSRVVVEGAREAVPIALEGIRVPDDLASWAQEFVPEPGGDRLFAAPTEEGFAWHPLIEGGEALYRYATGDTTRIRLQEGREIRLVELRVTPRERDIRVVTGSFWIDLDTHSIVQAVFRPAREFDLERDLPTIEPEEQEDIDEIPAFLKPIRFDIRYVTVEYGLWEMKWWMPRLMAFEGHVQVGVARLPVSLEVRYSDYTVEADPFGLPELPPLIRHLAGDPTSRPREYSYPIRVEIPDSTRLLDSPLLTESFYSAGEALLSERELRDLGDRLGALPPEPWEVGRPTVSWPWVPGRGLLRYNRIEGPSAGVRVDWDLTRVRTDLTVRLGAADLEPRGEVGVEFPTLDRTWRVAGYRRLAATDPSVRALGLGNSLNAFLLGRDDGMYYQSTGLELTVTPEPGTGRWLARLYAEDQAAVEHGTDASLAHWVDADDVFRANIAADPADQVGLALQAGIERGLDPTGFRWGAWLDLTGETGTYSFVRPGATARMAAPLVAGIMGALEVAGGTTIHEDEEAPPVQAHWFLGGAASLRGFAGGELHGPDFARGRLELASQVPMVRIATFSDVGWAGTADAYQRSDVALSVGLGASLMDGLLRVDMARAIQPDPGWRLELWVDALF